MSHHNYISTRYSVDDPNDPGNELVSVNGTSDRMDNRCAGDEEFLVYKGNVLELQVDKVRRIRDLKSPDPRSIVYFCSVLNFAGDAHMDFVNAYNGA